MSQTLIQNAERRKHVRLRLRSDLIFTDQKYEGKSCKVVKDPVSLKYYRFNEREFFVLSMLDGKHTNEEVQKQFEKHFRPDRLTLEDLESFARQLVTAGLVLHESPQAAKHLYNQQRKQHRMKRVATFTNILYLKIPIFDPDRLLNWMIKYLWWMFSYWFLILSLGVMFAAVALVTMHFNTFYDKLPTSHEFFQFRTLLYMWISLGIVKVIHEFGHGLSCKAFASECHEMGFLLLCLSPALYCNVTDAWTVASKWKRIIISFAGIYVELMIAAIATFVWWYTPHMPFVNNVALSLMTLCSISTFMFNANPLMRFDGYYMMSDFLEIPNLRQRANKYLGNLFSEVCMGIEKPPEPYMQPGRKVLFVTYAVASYLYRWIITFSIIFMLATFLKPYKLETLSYMLAAFAFGTMIFWPLYRMVKGLRQRGRLPDMKMNRVMISSAVLAGILALFFFMPLPISRVVETGLVQVKEENLTRVYLNDPGTLKSLYVRDGETVNKGDLLAEFINPDMDAERADLRTQARIAAGQATNTARVYGQKQSELQRTELGQETLVRWEEEAKISDFQADRYNKTADGLESRLNELYQVRAPRSGVVMSPPRPEDVGKLFDQQAISRPFCSIGEPAHKDKKVHNLRIAVPVDPPNYRLLKENLAESKNGELEVSILVPGRSDHIFSGVVRELPQQDAKNVPLQLTQRGGGTLAVKPSDEGNDENPAPMAQYYLVMVHITDADSTIQPGVLVMAKIHCKWRSVAWWTWRRFAEMVDFGLW